MNELSKKSNHKRKLILDGLGSALGSMGPGLAIGGGLAAAGAAVGGQRQMEHQHELTMVENEMAFTTFSIEFTDVDIGNLFRLTNELKAHTERYKHLMQVMEADVKHKIDTILVGELPGLFLK